MGNKNDNLFEMDAVDVYKLVIEGNLISRFPHGYWRRLEAKKDAIRCTQYLVENVMKFSNDDIRQQWGQGVFSENCLRGMLSTVYNDSPYNALDAAYPGVFDKRELKGYRKKIA